MSQSALVHFPKLLNKQQTQQMSSVASLYSLIPTFPVPLRALLLSHFLVFTASDASNVTRPAPLITSKSSQTRVHII